jgi:hypothetical protein
VHLTQAIEILSDTEGGLAKKKLTNNFVKPIYKAVAASLQIDESLIAVTAQETIKPIAGSAPVVAAALPIQPTEVVVPSTPAELPQAIQNTYEEIVEDYGLEQSMAVAEPIAAIQPIAAVQATTETYGAGVNFLEKIANKAKEELAKKAALKKIAITTENLAEAWQEIIAKYTVGKEFFATSMQKALLSFQDDTVTITAVDMMGMEFMQSNKLQITQHLMTTFANTQLKVLLQKEVNTDDSEIVPIRNTKDRYADLVQENNLVEQFKTELGLDFE